VTPVVHNLEEAYEQAIREYLAEPSEARLGGAYALGRAALEQGLSMLDIVNVHHRFLVEAVDADASMASRAIDAGGQFLLEALSTFEMAQRGFQEAQRAARLEHEHAASLRGLADAAVAINARRDAQSLVKLVVLVARQLMGANAALVTVSPDEPQGEVRERSLDIKFAGWKPTTLVGRDLAEVALGGRGAIRLEPEELAELAAELGEPLNGGLAVPLVARDDRRIGLIELVDKEDGAFSANDEAMAVQLAQMTAGALENVRLYQREHHIAETLQQSLLPERLPEIPGATVAARYHAAGEGQEVGGDFYDLFRSDGGRWLVVIGDVCGKGPQAAAITALARYTVRATALREDDPQRLLATLNQAMLAQLPPLYFCSVACAKMTLDGERLSVEVVAGGHPLPMVRRATGAIEDVGQHGTLLGLADDPELPAATFELAPGEALVMYTDGLFDTGTSGAPPWGPGRVEALLAAVPSGDAGAIVDILEATAVEDQDGSPRDDIAVLAVARVAAQS